MFRRLWILCIVLSASLPLAAQNGARNGEWRAYAADPGSTKYSPLDQVNRENAKSLRIAWRFRTDNLGPRPDYNMQSVPLVVNDTMYVQAGTRRTVVALNPTSGEMLWMWRMDEGKRGASAPRQGSGRGLAFWTDGKGDDRIVTVTPGYHLVALNARTGVPVASFGKNGVVDLKTEIDQPTIDLETADIGLNSPPAIGNNVIVVGAAHLPGGAPRAKENVKGYIRGYDVRSGKRLWIFHTIPQPGEFGNDTWLDDSWSYTGNAGNWAPISIDEELNRVYLATEDATGDYYGGHRPGNNLFTSSVVCLDLNTGKRYWYFQAIHHDIWDWDFPAPPILMNITVNGKPIRAVAVPSKQAFLYTFDRVTGEPLWPIVERPVPRGKVPSEWYAPTQPYPTRPAAYDMQGIRESDVNDWTPEIKAEALRVLNLHKYSDNLFEPPIDRNQDGKFGMLMMPGNNGGTNWEGGAFDPETGIAYIFSSTEFNRRSLINDPARSNMNFIDGGGGGRGGGGRGGGAGGGGRAGGPGDGAPAPAAEGGRGAAGPGPSEAPPLNAFGLPLIKPPYGRVTAINMSTGDHVWMKPIGEPSDAERRHDSADWTSRSHRHHGDEDLAVGW
jgi:quinoprotein glucose dehydrogenase